MTDALPVFSAQSGESGGVVLYSTALPAFSKKHRGNPVPTPGLSVAILCPRQN